MPLDESPNRTSFHPKAEGGTRTWKLLPSGVKGSSKGCHPARTADGKLEQRLSEGAAIFVENLDAVASLGSFPCLCNVS